MAQDESKKLQWRTEAVRVEAPTLHGGWLARWLGGAGGEWGALRRGHPPPQNSRRVGSIALWVAHGGAQAVPYANFVCPDLVPFRLLGVSALAWANKERSSHGKQHPNS
jgi:hypothetical protein